MYGNCIIIHNNINTSYIYSQSYQQWFNVEKISTNLYHTMTINWLLATKSPGLQRVISFGFMEEFALKQLSLVAMQNVASICFRDFFLDFKGGNNDYETKFSFGESTYLHRI